MGYLFNGPKTPEAPPPPPPPPPAANPPTLGSGSIQSAAAAMRAKAAAAGGKGMDATLLTGGRGAAPAPGAKEGLTGQ